MCGITGIFDTRGKRDIDRAVLTRMNESQHHRGPDEGGLHIEAGVGPVSYTHLDVYKRQLMESFGKDCEVLTVVGENGRPLSSVLSFYFRDEVLPYYAGDDLSARDLAANDFKYWELMRRACVRGIRVFDYGRSKQGTGSYSCLLYTSRCV